MNLPPFKNEPFTDFSKPENKSAMKAAIATVRAELGRAYAMKIGGKAVQTGETFTSVNPARPAEVIGKHYAASAADAEKAVEAAQTAFATWRKTSVEDRAALLV